MVLNDFEERVRKINYPLYLFYIQLYDFLHIRSGKVVSMITENNRDRTINDDCIHGDCTYAHATQIR